jgi:hypothetical protein
MADRGWDKVLLYQFYFHYKLLLGCVKVELVDSTIWEGIFGKKIHPASNITLLVK